MRSEHHGSDLKIDEKNEAPTIDKKIDGSKSTNDAAIGDVVNYTLPSTPRRALPVMC